MGDRPRRALVTIDYDALADWARAESGIEGDIAQIYINPQTRELAVDFTNVAEGGSVVAPGCRPPEVHRIVEYVDDAGAAQALSRLLKLVVRVRGMAVIPDEMLDTTPADNRLVMYRGQRTTRVAIVEEGVVPLMVVDWEDLVVIG